MKLLKPILIFVLGLLLMTALPLTAQESDTAQTPAAYCENALPAEEPETREFTQPEDVLEVGVDYYAIICTANGAVVIDLFETITPLTVNNFVFLAQNGYYNNTTFHRVIADFMAQGGDPTGTGSGGPGYAFRDEFVSFLNFDRVGLLAMANSGPNTNGSQFFLTTEVTDWLNQRHTIFGDVVVGQDVVEAIPLRDPASATEPGPALQTVIIVTDPALIDADLASEDVEAVVAEDFETVMEDFPDLPDFLVTSDATGLKDAAALAANAGENSDALTELLEANSFAFAFDTSLDNAACDLASAPFASIGYAVYAFESAEDAQNLISSEDLGLLVAPDAEVTLAEDAAASSVPVYVAAASACDQDGEVGYMVRQTGRFIVVSEILKPLDEAGASAWLEQVVNGNVYDVLFGPLLARELRAR